MNGDTNMNGNAVHAIADLARQGQLPQIVTEDEKRWVYFEGKLTPITWDPQPGCIGVLTLQGLVAYLEADAPFTTDELLAVVDSPARVTVYGPESSKTRTRPVIAKAELDSALKAFPFGNWMDQETFLIDAYTLLDREAGDFRSLVDYASKVVDEESINLSDDGISQSAVLRRTLSSEEEREKAKSIVSLRPFRSFREIEQPTGLFVFRMKKSQRGVEFALFEADGGSWRLEAMKRIGEFVRAGVPGLVVA
jgi:hypothetical protein